MPLLLAFEIDSATGVFFFTFISEFLFEVEIHVYFYRYGFLADLGNMERDKPTCGSEWREAKSIMISAACGRFMVHLLHHAFWQRATKEVSQ